MGKNKKQVPPKQEPLITEEERTTNPIFNVVYKRIRNLTKKLNNIDALSEQDRATLKPEQIRKIESRNEVVA